MDHTFQITLDEAGFEILSGIKEGYKLVSDRGAFLVSLSLAAEMVPHIDANGNLTLLDGTKIKVMPFVFD